MIAAFGALLHAPFVAFVFILTIVAVAVVAIADNSK